MASSSRFSLSLGYQCRQRVRQTKEIRPAILLGLKQCSQPIRPTTGLQEHRSMHSIERSRFLIRSPVLVGSLLPFAFPFTFGAASVFSGNNVS
jgi:hypothetical protein